MRNAIAGTWLKSRFAGENLSLAQPSALRSAAKPVVNAEERKGNAVLLETRPNSVHQTVNLYL